MACYQCVKEIGGHLWAQSMPCKHENPATQAMIESVNEKLDEILKRLAATPGAPK